jgi:protein-tyrosine phosphatase
MFDLRACHVERTTSQDYLIHWRGARPGQEIAVYMSDTPDHYYSGSDPGTPLLRTSEAEVLVSNPDPGVRHYFYLESEDGEAVILAERKLSLQGTPNFRDLGGYETDDGRRLKWGKLYRSSKLSELTDVDVHYVNRLGLTLVCDFRQVLEQELEPSRLGGDSRHMLASLPVAPGSLHNFLESLHSGVIDVDDAAGLMREINRDFVASQIPQYAEMFRLLLSANQQVLIHCASGKDRTGFGAALILDVLGVAEDSILEDYLLTNRYLPLDKEIARLTSELSNGEGTAVTEDVLRPLLEVRPEYIAACFEEIRKRYDSREHFFESALNLDEEKLSILRDRYLH